MNATTGIIIGVAIGLTVTIWVVAYLMLQHISPRLEAPLPEQKGIEKSGRNVFAPPTDAKATMQVFLCHSSNDKKTVRLLYRQLCAEGLDAWLDEEKLLPGQDWEQEIPRAVRSSDVVIVCLSLNSISKSGYVQKEIKQALDAADAQPDGNIFLIPLKLEPCEVPERLKRWQWVNYYEESGFERLMKALQTRASQLGKRLS
jgi:hypothetical protein